MAKNNKKLPASNGRKANAFPFLDTPMPERLRRSNNIDLTNNHTIIDHGNGYCEIRPIDDKLTS